MSLDFDPLWSAGGPSGLGWSEIAPLWRCDKEYQLARVRGVNAVASGTPDYFYVGSALHAGRAMWLAKKCDTGPETLTMIEGELVRVRAEYEAKQLPVRESAVRDAQRWMKEYIEHYSAKPRPLTVAVEHLLEGVDMTGDGHVRTARLDDVSVYEENGGTLCIGEFKTGMGQIAQTVSEYMLHGQPYLQWLMWQRAVAGAPQYGQVSAIVLDVMQKGVGGKRCTFGRVVVTPEPFALKWYEKWLGVALRRAGCMQATDDVPRNITSCARPRLSPWGTAVGACAYRNLCMYGTQAAAEFAGPGGRELTEEDVV